MPSTRPADASFCSCGTPAASRTPTFTTATSRSLRRRSLPRVRRSPRTACRTTSSRVRSRPRRSWPSSRTTATLRRTPRRPGSTVSRSTRPTTTCSSNSFATAPTTATTSTAARSRTGCASRLPWCVAVVDVWGADRVGIRLSPATTQPGGARDRRHGHGDLRHLSGSSSPRWALPIRISSKGVTYTTHESARRGRLRRAAAPQSRCLHRQQRARASRMPSGCSRTARPT